MEEQHKYCNQCKKTLPISNFNKKNDEEYYTRCKICQDIHNKNEKNRYKKKVIPFEKSFASHPKSQFWHPTLNGNIKPRDVSLNSHTKYWFKCNVCNHDIDIRLAKVNYGRWCGYCANKKLCKNEDCNHCFKKSFASHPKSKFWHPTLNGNTKPRHVTISNGTKYWFKCNVCNHDFDITLGNVNCHNVWCGYCNNKIRCDNINCNHCFKNSFASHPKSVFWHKTLNGNTKPRDVSITSGKKYWFKCNECNHDICNSLANVKNGKWCGYCVNRIRCDNINCNHCFKNSFASHPKSKFWHPTLNGNTKPRDLPLNFNKKCWFKCNLCNHNIYKTLNDVTQGSWCGYCNNKIRCDNINCNHCFKNSFASHPKSVFWHPTLNGHIKPRNIALNDNKKYWFKCNECNSDFDIILCDVNSGRWCRFCTNKTEQKLKIFLENNYTYKIIKEFKKEWSRNPNTKQFLRYDFCFSEIKLIIELDGRQHFEQVSNWGCPDEQKKTDIYKMKVANENGYKIIRILQEDVLYDRNDWQNKLTEIISKFIEDNNSIYNYVCIGDIYDNGNIFLDYNEIKKQIKPFKEELIQKCFNPNRVSYYLEQYNYDIGNDEYMKYEEILE